MSSAPRLASAAGLRLAEPPVPGGPGRPSLRRRVALGLGLLALAALAALAATGALRRSSPGPAAAVAGLQAEPRGRAGPARAQDRAAPGTREEAGAPARVVAPAHAASLFAPHSWYVAPPPKAPPPPPPAPEPRAPPLPYTLVGSYASQGEAPVFFLKRGDRVIDARVGDKIDGVYQLESAAGGQLVFVYLPLNTHQALAAGASR